MADRYEKLFWIIPISALVVASIIGAGAIEYKMNTILPNAEIELLEIKQMSCPEIKAKNSIGRYWTPENGKIGRAMLDSCKVEKPSTGLSPFVEFCDTTPLDPPFWPDKLIQNSTHKFNHEYCIWEERNG